MEKLISWIDSSILAASLQVSPDSKRVTYATLRRGILRREKWVVVVDGVEGKEYDIFLRGTKLIFDSAHTLHYLAVRGNRIYLVEEQLRE